MLAYSPEWAGPNGSNPIKSTIQGPRRRRTEPGESSGLARSHLITQYMESISILINSSHPFLRDGQQLMTYRSHQIALFSTRSNPKMVCWPDPTSNLEPSHTRPMEDVLPWPGNVNMAFDLRPTEDVLSWPGNANMAFYLQPTGDVLPWPDNANMAFDLRPTKDVLSWLGNANMAFDLRLTGDVLPWLGNANMAFDLRLTGDVLPWPGNDNMAFDLRPTGDVLPWPGNANMAFDLVPDLKCLLRT
nr:hypothetical protein [Tanacetum cinerariifolium]